MTASPTPPTRRRRFALRFSLRVLLIAFTAFAIGFPIWYRWPYTEEELLYPGRRGQPDKTRPSFGRQVTSWQRQWGGGRLKHGPSATFWNAYDQREETTYRFGKEHGPARLYEDGRLTSFAEFQDDGKIISTVLAADGSVAFQRAFLLGKQHGEAEEHLPGGRVIRYRYAHGRVTHVDGRPFKSRLLDRLNQGTVDVESADQLKRGAVPEGGDTLRDVLEWLGRENGIPVVVHSRAAISVADCPGFCPDAIDVVSAIVLTAHAAACECDYHNGCIWVLPDFGDGTWRDPTGVSAIQLPEGTSLAAAWRESVGGTGRQGPLEALAKQFGIAIDWAAVMPILESKDRPSLDIDTCNMELRHALTLMLFHNHCRCELRGETLVILPIESNEGDRR